MSAFCWGVKFLRFLDMEYLRKLDYVNPKLGNSLSYPTRTAPLDEFWPEIQTLLENDPKLKPYANH
ncbi:MAG: hypothetical protein SGI77_11795 [Pirellulaceae bacterium]|nr:hypothetical protein [Pirellulaceae bacterium]